jgi:hypothetical protein
MLNFLSHKITFLIPLLGLCVYALYDKFLLFIGIITVYLENIFILKLLLSYYSDDIISQLIKFCNTNKEYKHMVKKIQDIKENLNPIDNTSDSPIDNKKNKHKVPMFNGDSVRHNKKCNHVVKNDEKNEQNSKNSFIINDENETILESDIVLTTEPKKIEKDK